MGEFIITFISLDGYWQLWFWNWNIQLIHEEVEHRRKTVMPRKLANRAAVTTVTLMAHHCKSWGTEEEMYLEVSNSPFPIDWCHWAYFNCSPTKAVAANGVSWRLNCLLQTSKRNPSMRGNLCPSGVATVDQIGNTKKSQRILNSYIWAMALSLRYPGTELQLGLKYWLTWKCLHSTTSILFSWCVKIFIVITVSSSHTHSVCLSYLNHSKSYGLASFFPFKIEIRFSRLCV